VRITQATKWHAQGKKSNAKTQRRKDPDFEEEDENEDEEDSAGS